MPPRPPVIRLREIENGLGLLAAEVEEILKTKPLNLLYWQQELREVIAQLEAGDEAGRKTDDPQAM